MLVPTVEQSLQQTRAVMRMRISVAKEEKKVDYPWAHVFGTTQQRMRRNYDVVCKSFGSVSHEDHV